MLDKNPKTRISVKDALNHPWFSDFERTSNIMEKFFNTEFYYERGYTFSHMKNSSRIFTPISLNGKLIAADENNVIYSSLNVLKNEISRSAEESLLLTTCRDVPS
jgi:serine/threonine protein kinase